MRKFFLIILSLVGCAVFWYLFLKQYDYQFRTTARYNPGAVFSELSEIENFTSPYSKDELQLVSRERFTTLIHRLKVDSTAHIQLHWDLEEKNDSTTALTVSIASPRERLKNRWAVLNPFQESIFVDSMKRTLLAFKQRLDNQQQAYGIDVQKELVRSPELSCVCTSSQNIPIAQKALEMVRTISYLEDYLLFSDIKLRGNPFLKVTSWNMEQDLIDFDFCFPVDPTDDLVQTNFVKAKKYAAVTSLRAEFRGNYRISHIAWHQLLYYAGKKGIATTGLPLEVFHNNPKNEESPSGWKAEIFLPLKD